MDTRQPHLIVLGAGGHARVVADAAQSSGRYRSIRLMTPDAPTDRTASPDGYEILRGEVPSPRTYPPEDHAVAIGIGDVNVRLALAERLVGDGYILPPIVHASTWHAPSVVFAPGVVVMAGAIVQCGTTIGLAAIVNTRAGIDHDCVVGAGAHVAPGATLCGHVSIGRRVHVGAGATVKNGVTVCDDVTIGAGAAVVRDIGQAGQWIGVPARLRL